MPKKEVFSLKFIFEHSIGVPENFKNFEEYKAAEIKRLEETTDIASYTKEPYLGYMRYTMTLDLGRVTVIAKLNKNGGYHVKDYIIQNA